MTIEDALIVVDTVLAQKRLNNVQELLFRQAWEGQTYSEIAEKSGYDASYVRDVGYKLWQTLSKIMGERVTKSNVQVVFRRQAAKLSLAQVNNSNPMSVGRWDGVDRLNSPIGASAVASSGFSSISNVVDFRKVATGKRRDWGNALESAQFLGRTVELQNLSDRLLQDHCRLLGIFGMGGVGKTALTVKLAEQVQDNFDFLWWRSLRNAPPLTEMMLEMLQFLAADLPSHLLAPLANDPEGKYRQSQLIASLIQCLREARCLLVFDNVEAILQSGAATGQFLPNYEGYGELFQQIAETRHQSSLIITSREQPQTFVFWENEVKSTVVSAWQLSGLGDEAIALLPDGSASPEICAYYQGNPLALKMAAYAIQELFNGDLDAFWAEGTTVFGGIRQLLGRHCDRLSNLERQIMYWLALHQAPVTIATLQEDMAKSAGNLAKSQILESLSALLRRSLVQKSGNGFGQQPMLLAFMIEQLVDYLYLEISDGLVNGLCQYAISPNALGAQPGVDSLSQALLVKLLAHFSSKSNLSEALTNLQNQLRQSNQNVGYGMDNLRHLQSMLDSSQRYTSLTGIGTPRLEPYLKRSDALNLHARVQG